MIFTGILYTNQDSLDSWFYSLRLGLITNVKRARNENNYNIAEDSFTHKHTQELYMEKVLAFDGVEHSTPFIYKHATSHY